VIAYRAATLTELHDGLCDRLVTSTEAGLSVISSVDVQIHNVVAEAESMDWTFDLKDMWLTPSRWSMMVKQYIDPTELEAWIGMVTSKIGVKDRGIALMRTNTVKARGGAATNHSNKETRRWGACMLALSYKALPAPQITLYSRTSYLGYIGALDLTVAWMAAKYLARELNMEVEDFRFVWFNEAIQWHNFKSLAYLLNHHDPELQEQWRHLLMAPSSALTVPEKRGILSAPGLRLSRKWLQKIIQDDAAGRSYGDLTYNTYRRIIRRFHTEVYGYERAQEFEGWSYWKKGDKLGEKKEFFKAYLPLPSTPAHQLDFKRIGMPANRNYGEPFVGGDMEDDDDDE
jgi:hypothetical protein